MYLKQALCGHLDTNYCFTLHSNALRGHSNGFLGGAAGQGQWAGTGEEGRGGASGRWGTETGFTKRALEVACPGGAGDVVQQGSMLVHAGIPVGYVNMVWT